MTPNDLDQRGPSPFQRAMKKVAALEAEIEQLKFLNQEERQTIDDLAKLCIRAADALDKYGLSDDQKDLIAELRKAAQ
jgi:hypothetical protein